MDTLNKRCKAILAGMMIGISSIIYCMTFSISNVLGAFLFSNGLLAVILQEMNLYTGKIGYLSKSNALDMPMMLIYNIAGVVLICMLFHFTRIGSTAAEVATALMAPRLTDSYFSLFILGIGCGIMMFLAVDNYKKNNNPLFVIIPVMFFILCGFEHCIADAGYVCIAGMGYDWEVWFRILIIAFGNAVGSLMVSKVQANGK